jgi:hypothetical protein
MLEVAVRRCNTNSRIGTRPSRLGHFPTDDGSNGNTDGKPLYDKVGLLQLFRQAPAKRHFNQPSVDGLRRFEFPAETFLERIA